MVVQYVALLISEKMDDQEFKLVAQVAMVTKEVLTMILQYVVHLTSEKYGPSSIQTCSTNSHGNKTKH
jgi:hypothetical protein